MVEESNHYGHTAARAEVRPGREVRPQSVTIDMHSHVLVPAAAALVAPHLDLSTIPLAHFATDATKALNRKQDADRRPNMIELGVRLADMDAAGIDLQIVMPPPPQCYYTVEPKLGAEAASVVNEGIRDWVRQAPERFAGLGTVPMQDPAAAVRELERCMRELGLKGVQILTNVAGKELSDPQFEPFWDRAEALGAVVLLHPNGFTEAERLRRFYFNNVIGNPLDTSIALHYLIFDGVLERHPRLKLIAVHGGGYLPAYAGRIDHAWGARTDAHGELPHPPTSYLKRVYLDTIVFTPHQLDALVRSHGTERLLMGTDYPYDMAEADPIGHLASASTLDGDAFAAVAGGNAKALFGV
jgi:aminocarboxymuconate-semialdehyde decarboxylase